MPAITLDQEIKKYLPLLGVNEKESLLCVNRSFMLLRKEPIAPTRLTIAQYNKELEEAEALMDAGEFTSLDEAIEQSESW